VTPSSAAIATAPPAAAPPAVTAPAVTTPAVAVPPVATAKPRPALAGMLDTKTLDRNAAFASLYTLWGEDYSARSGDGGCEFARRVGLRCLAKTGTWKVLRRLDLPVILTLHAPSGDKHYATMTTLGDETATLDLAGESVTFALGEIDRLWDGGFVALWKTHGLATADLRPGMTSPDVVWLRQQLTVGGGADGTVFDDELKRRVVAFQRENGLTPDGIVGDETLLRITALAPDARMPSLSKARR
jgi:general secretion pathway protein A